MDKELASTWARITELVMLVHEVESLAMLLRMGLTNEFASEQSLWGFAAATPP